MGKVDRQGERERVKGEPKREHRVWVWDVKREGGKEDETG